MRSPERLFHGEGTVQRTKCLLIWPGTMTDQRPFGFKNKIIADINETYFS
jgi:hypothetical protein